MDNYAALGAKQAGRNLGRSATSVRTRAHRLGLRCRRAWTAYAEGRVCRTYRIVGARALAAELGRTVYAVQQRAFRLGVTRRVQYTAEEVAEVREILTALEEHLGRPWRGIVRRLQREPGRNG